jgi:outer membrane receptor protein involved in Fe transport
VRGAYTAVDINDQIGLSSGEPTYQAAYNIEVEGHTNRTFGNGLGRWTAGAAYQRQRVDSANPQGVQTNYEQPETADTGSVFGQVDYRAGDRLKLSFAGRLDGSTLSGTTMSPRAAAVYEIDARQRVRVAAGRAYKAPTIAGLRLRAPVAPPVDLSPLELALAPVLGGTSLGFARIPVLAAGNEALEPEAVTSIEGGYSIIAGDRTFVQATYYRNSRDTFTSGLLPQIGTSLGRLNPSFGPYRPPDTLNPTAAAIVQQTLAAALPPALLATLSNGADGSPLFVVASFGNFGSANAQGLDLSAVTRLDDRWRVEASYAWFDFSIDNDAADVPLVPNTPRHQGSAGVVFSTARGDAGLRARFVDGFAWVSGIYSGRVPGYGVVDLQTNYRLTDRFSAGLDVSNLLDRSHYQMFGGDLLSRRALVHVTAGW